MGTHNNPDVPGRPRTFRLNIKKSSLHKAAYPILLRKLREGIPLNDVVAMALLAQDKLPTNIQEQILSEVRALKSILAQGVPRRSWEEEARDEDPLLGPQVTREFRESIRQRQIANQGNLHADSFDDEEL